MRRFSQSYAVLILIAIPTAPSSARWLKLSRSEKERPEDLGGRGRKTLKGESPLFRRGGSLPPNLPLSPRTSPKSTRPCRVKIGFALFRAGAPGGSSFVFGEVRICCSVRLSRLFCGREALGYNALHECRALYCRERPMCRSLSGDVTY